MVNGTQPPAPPAPNAPGASPAAQAPMDLIGMTSDNPSQAPMLIVPYGQPKTSKTTNTVLAFDRPFVLYTNPTILKPLAFACKQIDTVRPGLVRELGIPDPRRPFDPNNPFAGILGRRYVTREDAKRWLASHPHFGMEAQQNNFVGAFYMFARYALIPQLGTQLAPGGVYHEWFDSTIVDETSTFMQMVFDDLCDLGKNFPRLYNKEGLRWCTGDKGSFSVFRVYDTIQIVFRELFFDHLYHRTDKHLATVCHEQPPRYDRNTKEMNWIGGPKLPSGGGIESFVQDATVYWRMLAVDSGAVDKERQRIDALAMATHNAQLAELEARRAAGIDSPERAAETVQTLQLTALGSAKAKVKKSMDIQLPNDLSTWMDDLGWQSKLIRFTQTEEANEYAAGGREPFTQPYIASDLRAALAFGGAVEPRPRLRDVLTSDELARLQRMGRMIQESDGAALDNFSPPVSVAVPGNVTGPATGPATAPATA